ncbi:Ig-like domain-containing protein [Nocardia sp. NPDC127579]|uniref:L,D-transpeptidase n=1 Tax=Nocardia sp. NPDC127579 TaxID=3345402 RepID=UPI003643C9C3
MNNRPVIRRPVGVLSLLLFVVAALVAGCGTDNGAPTADTGRTAAQVTLQPGADATAVNPAAPVSVEVTDGVIDQVALTNANGKQVSGEFSPDRRKYAITEPLGYDAAYTWSGTARGGDNQAVPIEGGFHTLTPKATVGATFQLADGQQVGIGAPIILQFHGRVTDKAAVERALKVTTDPGTEGAWAWFPDDSGGSRVHWRPKNYWQPGTTVHVAADLYGVDFGGGRYGDADLTSDFTIGRSQIVKADAPSHRIQVIRDGQVTMDFAASYGEGNEPRNVTRSGVHIVTEKYEMVKMSNPPYYTDVEEHWAVRISNNGEFIHANPESSAAQGNSNVTNGCINLSTADAREYFGTALYGDPVEVTGTSIPLSAADGDVYDWAIPWEQWQTMSAASGSA